MPEIAGAQNTSAYTYIIWKPNGPSSKSGCIYVVPPAKAERSLKTLRNATRNSHAVILSGGYREAASLTSDRNQVVIWSMTIGHKVHTSDGPPEWNDCIEASRDAYES